MIKPRKLQAGDKVAIVSLSSGVLGEPFVDHELKLGERRLRELGLSFEYMPNAKKGIEYIKKHPEARAEDLKQAFKDPSVKGVICAIGGDDTYRTLPFLLDDSEFIENVRKNPKIFLGFSDTTINHLMFYKLGLRTYYGPAFLTDFAEFANTMLPYTKEWVYELFDPTLCKEILSSPVWYGERKSFGLEQIGVDRETHEEVNGFEVLRGSGIVSGELLGGCMESMYEALAGGRNPGQEHFTARYQLFPSADEWQDKIFFVETSEEKPSPEKLRKMLAVLAEADVFAGVSAILVGKPQDEKFYEDYKAIWLEATKEYDTSILYNLNFGHATPRCILPYGGRVKIDFNEARVFLRDTLVEDDGAIEAG